MRIDINCDMGEGFGIWQFGVDEQIIKYISSANIAGGFHAGDPQIINKTVALAKQNGVAIGIHCGFRDLVGFGRRIMQVTAEEVKWDLLYQLGALREIATYHGIKIQHVKPHGALYMLAAQNEEISRGIIEAIQCVDPGLLLYCMDSSVTNTLAKQLGQPVVAEFYADREYSSDGKIVFTRSVKQDLNPTSIAQKVIKAITEKKVTTIDGEDINIHADSVCVHSDTPGILNVVEKVVQSLKEHGINISPFTSQKFSMDSDARGER